MCGRDAEFSNWGSHPSWSPYQGDSVSKAIIYRQGNVVSENTDVGGWHLVALDTSHPLSPLEWRAGTRTRLTRR